jgi:hypothetical protein
MPFELWEVTLTGRCSFLIDVTSSFVAKRRDGWTWGWHSGRLPPIDLSGQDMKASVLYRIAAVLIVLFDIGHTFGFRQSDPSWGVAALVGSMRSIHFDVQGFSRSYWDLFVWAGFFVAVFLLFAAVVAWELSGLSTEALAHMRRVSWGLALSFVALTILSWRYFFFLPILFSVLITACLVAAAWLSEKAT